MDRNGGKIITRNQPGMTIQNIGTVMELLEANYGLRLYKDTNRENVLKLWSGMFAKDDPREVLTAVKEYIEQETFPPTVADIKRIMKRNRNHGREMTVTEVLEESNRLAATHGMTMTDELAEKHAGKVADFLKPITADDKKRVELAENRKAEWSLK